MSNLPTVTSGRSIKVRVSVQMRNEAMLRAREAAGLTQAALAELCDCSSQVIGYIEQFNFKHGSSEQIADRIAGVLDIDRDDVMPPEMRGKWIPANMTTVVEADQERMVQIAEDTRRMISLLPKQRRKVIELRYGIGDESGGHSLGEVGRMIGVTRERVRQIEAAALRQMQEHVKEHDDDQ